MSAARRRKKKGRMSLPRRIALWTVLAGFLAYVALAFGANKQDAVKGCVEGPMSQFCTASALQAHNDCWIFCDEAAAKKLKLKKYYAWRSSTKLGL